MKTQLNTFAGTLTTALSLGLIYVCIAATHLAGVDLKGEWTYSAQKSKPGSSQYPIAPLKLKITTEANGIAIERTTAGFNGGENMVSTDHLTFDGKVTENTAFGNSKKKSTAVWSADGKQLTVTASIMFDQNGTQREFKSTEIYSLSEDGKVLTMNFASQSFEGLDGIFAYDKTN
jgi:hypothetical protein